jgi:hypothetical protein
MPRFDEFLLLVSACEKSDEVKFISKNLEADNFATPELVTCKQLIIRAL